MEHGNLVGNRIRAQRIKLKMKQADLAQKVGISASYLNLIEHNRRRIAGKLLLNIAAVFEVEVSTLTQGVEATLIAALREVATDWALPKQEIAQAEELADRFPAWARLLAEVNQRILTLERRIVALSDRLAHDPKLAASLHEMLSVAAAIRSTASILKDDSDLSEAWRRKFHKNLDQDSRRLANSSKELVRFLDANMPDTTGGGGKSPSEELALFFQAHQDDVAQLESGSVKIAKLLANSPQLVTRDSRVMALGVLRHIVSDRQKITLDQLKEKLGIIGLDPVALAAAFDVALPVILRRLAALQDLDAGLVQCDRAGALLFQKNTAGFSIPRFGPLCPRWPIFDVFSQPNQVIRRKIFQPGRAQSLFESFSIAYATGGIKYNETPYLQALMLIVPLNSTSPEDEPAQKLGSTCKLCAITPCGLRRETSILRSLPA